MLNYDFYWTILETIKLCVKKSASLFKELVNQFIYLGSNISFTKSDVNILIGKAMTTCVLLISIWKSDLSDKIKWEFFQAVTVSVQLYGCTT